MGITLLVCDASLAAVADPVTSWTNIDCTIKHNDTGAGTFTAPASPALVDAVTTPGNRVCLIRDGRIFSSGPIEKPGSYKWSASKDGRTGLGEVTVAWADNLALVARHLSYPNPALAATAQDTDKYTATGVNAETLMRTLVNVNCGPGALAARQEPALALGTVAGVGSNVNLSTRFEPLGDVLRTVALAGGSLGFRIREDRTSAQLLFEVFAPVDRTASIRFSRDLNNLRELSTDPDAPTATAALVGGDGTGAARTIIERTNVSAAAWGRSETWVNQAGDADTTQMQQAGDKALSDGAEKVRLTVVAVDTPAQTFGRDFWLGDKVSVLLPTGAQVADIVSAAHLTATPTDGVVVAPTIGTDTAASDDPTLQMIRDMERRVGRLERS